MKKIILSFIIVIFLFVSCNASLKLLDEDGFAIYQCGWSLNDNQILIQSHDGYVLNEIFYTEHIDTIYNTDSEEKTVTIENRLNKQIDVKIIYRNTTKWIEVNANDYYLIEVACFQ